MAGVGWTNVFMHLLAPAPIIGEGFATGFNGGIEIESFEFDLGVDLVASQDMAEHAKAIIGLGAAKDLELGSLTFTKRFDASTPLIMYAIDNDLPVITATISVIGMLQTGKPIHEPGLVLVFADGKFIDIETKIESEGRGSASVRDKVQMSFTKLMMTYMRDTVTGKNQTNRIPTMPFVYQKAQRGS